MQPPLSAIMISGVRGGPGAPCYGAPNMRWKEGCPEGTADRVPLGRGNKALLVGRVGRGGLEEWGI